DHHRRPRIVAPAGRLLVEICGEAVEIGIVPPQHDRCPGCGGAEGVDRADGGGPGVEVVAESCSLLLVRNGDVATDELTLPQTLDAGRQGVRSDVDGLVAAGDAGRIEPVAMDQRRARMGDGVADDEGAFHVNPSLTAGPGRAAGAPPGAAARAAREWQSSRLRGDRRAVSRAPRGDSSRPRREPARPRVPGLSPAPPPKNRACSGWRFRPAT